jgi:putative DNA primase/helicase
MSASAFQDVLAQIHNVPHELQVCRQWICYRAVPSKKRAGKTDKLPCSPFNGEVINAHDPAQWADFSQAVDYVRSHPQQVSGVGFVLTAEDPFVGIDLDNCVRSGEIKPWAMEIVNKLKSYTEISPSGTGLRIFLRGALPPRGRRKGAVEMYTDGRFLTLTGNHVSSTPAAVEDRHAGIVALHRQFFGAPMPVEPSPEPSTSLDVSDQELISLMSRVDAEFDPLWRGDTSRYSGDHSAADAALCRKLAYYTQGDAQRMDRLFRAGGLMRDKWDERRGDDTYGGNTIAYAIQKSKASGKAPPATVTAGGARQSSTVTGTAATTHQAATSTVTTSATQDNSFVLSSPHSPYSVLDGRIVYHHLDRSSGREQITPVADFTATITQEILSEYGNRHFVVEGIGKRGGKYRVEVPADAFGEDRRLRSLLESAVGALDPVYAGQGKHLASAIKKLTNEQELCQVRTYNRTGWTVDGKFLIPGREDGNVRIELNRKLAYALDEEADLVLGLQALDALIESVGAERTTILLAHSLTGPMARLAGWRNERYAVMARGLTGTFKTTVSQLIMSIWGADFVHDERLIKWGEGATRNAVMALAAGASDLPFFIDNYKPQTGDGERDFINLIHNILEGGEKDRLNRFAQLRETKPVHCWPLLTGEDVPASDAASLARVLLVNFEKQAARQNAQLSFAQKHAGHLCAVGSAWLNWIEDPSGQDAIQQTTNRLAEVRSLWADYLHRRRTDLANPLRVATNLAMNELAYLLACENPVLGNVLKQYRNLHIVGLEAVANAMADSTAESLEALRFLSALRELLATDRALLVDKAKAGRDLITPQDRDRVIGWVDKDGSVYLLTEVTINLIERHTKEKFHSNQQLFSQFDDLGFLGQRDPGRQTKSLKIDGHKHRTVHLLKEAFEI